MNGTLINPCDCFLYVCIIFAIRLVTTRKEQNFIHKAILTTLKDFLFIAAIFMICYVFNVKTVQMINKIIIVVFLIYFILIFFSILLHKNNSEYRKYMLMEFINVSIYIIIILAMINFL